MRLTLLGTGCPVVNEDRYGPAHLIKTDNASLLIDCGSGVTQRLLNAGASGRDIDAIFLTHLHSDHIIDLYQLIVSSWHQGRDRPQFVYGPRGTRRYVQGLMDLWETERLQRIEHELRPSIKALEVETSEFSHGDTFVFSDLTVTAIEVDHRPVRDAFGFVFEHGGSKLVFSGDTAPCDSLAEAARGADLLLHEVFIHREMPIIEGVRTAEGLRNVAGYHTPSNAIGKIASDASVGMLVLTHFVPPDFDKDALQDEISGGFKGTVVIGEDGMTIDVAKRRLRDGKTVLSFGKPAPSEE